MVLHEQDLGNGLLRRKDNAGDWRGCATATVSAASDEFIIGEVTRGETSQGENCNVFWYEEFVASDSCTNLTLDDYWLDLEKERDMEDVASTGGSVSKTQCGASGGGGPEVRVGVAILVAKQLATPTNLSASLSGGNPVLTWNYSGSNSPVGFNIYRSNSSQSAAYSNYTLVGTSNNTSFEDDTGVSGTVHYRVAAFHDGGQSDLSSEENIQTIQPPVAPSNLNATTVSDTSISLSWQDNSSGTEQENNFNIYRSTSSQNTLAGYNLIDNVSVDTTAFTDTGLPRGSTFFYRVTAVNNAGETNPTNEDSDTTFTGVKVNGNDVKFIDINGTDAQTTDTSEGNIF